MLHLTRQRSARSDHAFTLVEVAVAAFVGMLVIAGAVLWIHSAFRGADRIGARSSASVAADQAVARLRQDLAAARAPDRASDAVYDPVDFAAAVRDGTQLRGYDADGVTIRTLDVQDVKHASRDTITFVASGPDGTRCVRWRSVGGELLREQLGQTGQGCSQQLPVTHARTLVRRTTDGRSTLGAPFSYVLAAPGAGGGCTTIRSTSVGTGQVGTIVAVLVDVQSLSGNAGADGRSGRQLRIDLRSRLAEEYQRALGCAR